MLDVCFIVWTADELYGCLIVLFLKFFFVLCCIIR